MTPEILFGLPGKTALVTGGATGIGRMAAEALVRAGAHVLLASRKEGACAAVAEELNALDAPGSAEGFVGDVGTEEGVDTLVAEVKARTGELHILMNNAGITWGAPYGQFPHKAWEKVMAVNVAGVFDLTQKLTPMLKASASPEDPARVVNVGSVMGEVPMGDGAYSYSASKAAVMHLTKILGKELAGAGTLRVADDRVCHCGRRHARARGRRRAAETGRPAGGYRRVRAVPLRQGRQLCHRLHRAGFGRDQRGHVR